MVPGLLVSGWGPGLVGGTLMRGNGFNGKGGNRRGVFMVWDGWKP